MKLIIHFGIKSVLWSFFCSCMYIYKILRLKSCLQIYNLTCLLATLNFPHNLELCSCLHVRKHKHLQHLCFPRQNCLWSLGICYTNVLFSLIISFVECMCFLGILLYDWNEKNMSLGTIQHLSCLLDMLNIFLVLKPRCDELPKSQKRFLSKKKKWTLHWFQIFT